MAVTELSSKEEGSGKVPGSVSPTMPLEEPTGVDGQRERKKQGGGGLTEGDEDMEASPINNIPLVFSAISLVLFLAALDQTIVATALPSIASDLHANPSQYGWVGTSYLLATTAFTPLWGRFSDIAGRKPVLYGGIIIFTIGSALCGAAKTINWLIACRAVQGIGGGAIMSLTTIVISDIIPLSKRGHYNGALGATWGIAAVLGPLLGGLLTDKASWRWCFYINLPTCAVAFVFLLFTLKLNPTKGHTFAQLKANFDFVGLVLIMSAGSLLVVGFAMASDHGFGNKSAIALIAVGAALLVASFAHFLTTSRNAIIPARALRTRTTTLFLLGSVLHATAFISSNYYVPVYLQGVRGVDALHSGIQLLPYSILVAVLTIVAGQIVTRLRIVRPVAWCGYALAGLGYGLWYEFLSFDYSIAVQEGILTVAAIGIGLSLQTPVIVIQAAMPLKDMAAATSAYLLARSLGGTLGISIFGAVLNAELRKRLSPIPGYGTDFQLPVTAEDYRAIHTLPDPVMRQRVIQAFSDSASMIWIIYCGLLLGALLVTLPTRAYSMNRAPPTKDEDGQRRRDFESQTTPEESM